MAVEATVLLVKKKLVDLDLLQNYNFLLPEQKTKVKRAVKKLQCIVHRLNTIGYHQEISPVQQWTIEILRAVYEVEDSIDTFVLSTTSSKLQRRRNLLVLTGIYVVLNKIHNRIDKFLEEIDNFNTQASSSGLLSLPQREFEKVAGSSSKILRHHYKGHESGDWQEIYDYFRHSSEIVGRKETINLVMNLLKGKEEGKLIIPLYHGEGAGKSTLVRFIYNQVDVKREFEQRAWVRISQKSECREVLIDLWKQITLRTTLSEESHKSLEENKLIENINNFLKDKKYLIILDGFTKGILDSYTLSKILPESHKRSRVIFTARNEDEFPINLNGKQEKNSVTINELKGSDCYDLFKERVRIKREPYQALKQQPDQVDPSLIEAKTGGIPLAIVLLAGVLSYTRRGKWKDVIQLEYDYETQYMYLEGMMVSLDIDKPLRNTLIKSYELLPTHLKPLFLYLGLFPKSFQIPVRRLLLLWIAEGLLPAGEVEPEKQARTYFMELVYRYMIKVAKWSSDGSPKTCLMPSMLYDVFTRKSLHLGFFYAHKHSDGEGDYRQLLKVRRLAEYYDLKNYPSTDLNTPHLRSYISFDTRPHDVPNQETGKFLNKMVIGRGFGLLRVLDLEGVFKPLLPETIGKMLHLKYVGLRWTFLDSLPSSLGNLPNLEALDVKHTYIHTLPTSIWKAEKLRHLYMNNIYLDKQILKLSAQSLIQFKTLSGLVLVDKSPLRDGLNQLKGLWKLSLTYYSIINETEMFRWISSLSHLESLKLRSIDESGEPSKLNLDGVTMPVSLTKLYLFGSLPATGIKFPERIRVLTLSFSGLKEDPMPILGHLEELKILKLFAKSYLGSQMTCDPKSFPNLGVLKLWMLKDLKKWSVAENAMPCLEELEIRCCDNLENIVDQLNGVTSLKELILTNMPMPFVLEAKNSIKCTCAVLVNQWTSPSTRSSNSLLLAQPHNFPPLEDRE